FSVFENAGMTIGITPITGIPLPFMSYGGSADIAFFAALGITLSVSRTGRRSKSAPIPASSRMSPVGSGGWFR
ncbi:MAG TPA: FtsW/RodA/SpoVE family cell cycle protein, partial [Acidimicrobiales bacterium]|nr:FtsW/RodA/SpoVE family cell cycle protein [Acidimicrobiales bacterium]